MFFQIFRIKKAEIKAKRLENDKRWNNWLNTRKTHVKYQIAVLEANTNKMPFGNSNHRKWVKKHLEQQDVKSKMKKHELASKILKGNMEFNQIFEHQAQEMKKSANKLQEEKEHLQSKGKFSEETHKKNHDKDQQTHNKMSLEKAEQMEEIQKTEEYLKEHDRFPYRFTIFK